jgi:aerotaxis receptor
MSHEYEIDASEYLVLLADKGSQFVYVNETYLRVSGYSWEELKGTPMARMLHKDTPFQVNQAMRRTLQEKESWTGIIKNQRKNGDHYWVRLNMSPLYAQGVYAGALLVHSHATRAEIERFEPLYRRMRADKSLRIRHGKAVRDTFIGRVLGKIRGLASRIVGTIITLNLTTLLSLLAVGGNSPRTWIAEALLLALSTLFGWHLLRTIVAPLREALWLSSQIAAGDLRALSHTERPDEIGALTRAVTQMSVNMHATVLDVRSGVRRLREATAEIANGTQELSGRTENQARHVEQTATAIGEISRVVKQTAVAARQASQFSQSACAAADSGGQVVGDVIATMQGITQSSKKIAEIIGVIDSIAFQTNILALNAAVEAARAGENGRGFAVVAGEVRSLAQRSAKSAHEIKILISTGVEQIAHGSTLVNVAGRTISEVVTQVRHVAELVGHIAAATVEQAAGVGAINEGVGNLDLMTRQNAALVQNNTLFAASLRTQSECLGQAVGVFKLSESENLELFNATHVTAEEGSAASLHTRAA